MGIILGSGAGSYEHLLPDGDESCFVCADPLLEAPVLVFEGSVGLVHGINRYAQRQEAIHLHPWCAESWAADMLAQAHEAQR